MPAPLLEVEHLRVEFPGRRGRLVALDDVSFSIAPGEVLGVVGESGAGKSLTGASIIGLLDPPGRIAGGEIRFDGARIDNLPYEQMRKLRGRQIGAIFQDPLTSLDPLYTVGQQLVETVQTHLGLNTAEARRRAVRLLQETGIPAAEERLDQYPHQFSGGMRQRAAIAMALALRPKLVIADEPVTALDVIVQRQVLDTIRNLSLELGLSAIIVTHDISVVAYLCSMIAVMYAGRIVEYGPTERVMAEPAHPYTMGLMNASPDLARAGEELTPIEGSPPSLLQPPPGCRFAPRCPFALAACREAMPATSELAPDHSAACLRAGEAAQLREKAREAATWRQ